jgi:hypothetical protein
VDCVFLRPSQWGLLTAQRDWISRAHARFFIRRGVRVVEGARLESVYTRKGIAGSNPALSANKRTRVPSQRLGIFYFPYASQAWLGEQGGNKKDARSASLLFLCFSPPFRDHRSGTEVIPLSPQKICIELYSNGLERTLFFRALCILCVTVS